MNQHALIENEGRQQIVGWREYVAFPEWGITRLIAKVDSGARTSSLHVENIEDLSGGVIRFDVVLSRKNPARRITVEARTTRTAVVRSSAGESQVRRFVTARVRIGTVEKDIELSLVSRRNMLCRMLLGRSALQGSFLVDAGRTYVLGRRGNRQKRSEAP